MVVAELSILGIRTESLASSCPAAEVEVSATGSSIAIQLRDASGRTANRVVSDARIAAT
jgi:hypothetical protein